MKIILLYTGTKITPVKRQEHQIIIENRKMETNLNKLGVTADHNFRLGVCLNLMSGLRTGSNLVLGSGMCLPEDISSDILCLSNYNIASGDDVR